MLDVLVVGSGYAGSVIAARLASTSRVLLVERGRWWRPGDFPDGIAGLGRAMMTARNRSGLWGMRLGKGTGNGFASAFGGSSVVNYGITVQPEDHVFDGWPVSATDMAPYFARAREVLVAKPNPSGDELGDKAFLDRVEPGLRFDLENTIDWNACTQCGRCVPGCNVGAKNSLDKTYLAMAMRDGVEVRLETEVRELVPLDGGGYAVELFGSGHSSSEWVKSKKVVLAAGTLGTLDILHRARDRLPLSRCFGRRLSMNGDGLAFLYNTRHRLSSHSGAPISTAVRIPHTDEQGIRRTLMVMSGRVPMAAMRFASMALSLVSGLVGQDSLAIDPLERVRRFGRRALDLAAVNKHGALSRTFMYKLDGQDDSRGRARFTRSGAVIDWPDYLDDPIVRFAERRLGQWAAQMGGTLVPNVARLPGMRSFSVHPLGGCRMGLDVDAGVVDEFGRVFDPRGGLHTGLRVADASIFAGSLGVPPSLTVTALAERIAESILREAQRGA